MELRDIASLTMSAIALVLSAATSYISLFREHLDVQMTVIGGIPSYKFSDERLAEVYAEYTLVFVNSGNRSVAITEAAYHVIKTSEFKKDHNPCTEPSEFGGVTIVPDSPSFSPVVVKASDISTVHVSFNRMPKFQIVRKDAPSAKRKNDRGENVIRVYGCLEIGFVIPGEKTRSVSAHITHTEVHLDDGGAMGFDGPYIGGNPVSLLRETRGIF